MPLMFNPAPASPGRGHAQDGRGFSAGEERENREAATVPAVVPFSVESRPKRRKTSEVVTTMEMSMRTMMIHVWSDRVSLGHVGRGGTYEMSCCQQ